jgi:hypothetical protein
MKLADIEPGSELAYQRAATMVIEQLEDELALCYELFGTDPRGVMDLLTKTENWNDFFKLSLSQPTAAP